MLSNKTDTQEPTEKKRTYIRGKSACQTHGGRKLSNARADREKEDIHMWESECQMDGWRKLSNTTTNREKEETHMRESPCQTDGGRNNKEVLASGVPPKG